MPTKRVYTDKEISAVLKRAAELQRTQGPAPTASGLSLAELEQVAADVGIDPDYVKAAAFELEEGRPDKKYHLWGSPTSIDMERLVDGAMTDEKWEEAVAEIRRVFNAMGEMGQTGRTRDWVLRDQTGERIHVMMAPVGEQTRIRLHYRMTDWAVAVHIPSVSIAIAPIILEFVLLNLGPLMETGLALFTVFALHMAARLLFGSIARRQERKARKLLARLDDLIATPEEAPPEPRERVAAPEPESGRLDDALLSGDVAAEDDPLPRRREREGRWR
jgi:hypothetical protein